MDRLESYYEELDLLRDRLASKHNYNEIRKIDMRISDLETRINQETLKASISPDTGYKIDIQ